MAIGEVVRAKHNGCSGDRDTATIKRTPPGWVLHCFKCGHSGFDYARVAALPGDKRAAPKSKTKIPLAPVALHTLSDTAVAHILTAFKMTWLDDTGQVQYDMNAARLCFPLSAIDKHPGNPASFTQGVGWVGKAQHATPKWYLSDNSKYVPDERAYIYLARSVVVPSDVLVLTEDPISALKISKSDPRVIAIAMLGLSMPPTLLELLGNFRKDLTIVVWPDGDRAGINRGTQIYSQVKFIRPNTRLEIVMDKDPKDLTMAQLGERLDRIRAEVD